MSLGLHKINRKRALPIGEVGEVGTTTPKPNSYTLTESYAQNKKDVKCVNAQEKYKEKYKKQESTNNDHGLLWE
jgi:hypothetical protein